MAYQAYSCPQVDLPLFFLDALGTLTQLKKKIGLAFVAIFSRSRTGEREKGREKMGANIPGC